jgi:tRNA 2-thiocytidine biosynthesis protein TtcA
MSAPINASLEPKRSVVADLERKISKEMTRLNARFNLFGEGDRILVGVSGGKDSYTMLHMLRRAQQKAPFKFDIVAFHLDQGHPGFPVQRLADYLESEGYDWIIEREDTYSIVTDKVPEGKTPCSLCSRLRRGILYNAARRHGCTKVALGHHRDDLVVTLMLNLFYSGMMATMPPKLRSDEGDNVVIRPLGYVPESWIVNLAKERKFPIIPCTLCGRGADLKRNRMARLLRDLEAEIPDVKRSLMAAMANVRPSHLLDERVYDHKNL